MVSIFLTLSYRERTGMSASRNQPDVSELLARMLDPNDPKAALRQEIEDAGVEHLAREARAWLRAGEQAPHDLEHTLRLVVRSVLEHTHMQ